MNCATGSVDTKCAKVEKGKLSQIRVSLSKLNFHRFKDDFRDTVNPSVQGMMPRNDANEDAQHFLFLCLLSTFNDQIFSKQPFAQINTFPNKFWYNTYCIVSYGNKELSDGINYLFLKSYLH